MKIFKINTSLFLLFAGVLSLIALPDWAWAQQYPNPPSIEGEYDQVCLGAPHQYVYKITTANACDIKWVVLEGVFPGFNNSISTTQSGGSSNVQSIVVEWDNPSGILQAFFNQNGTDCGTYNTFSSSLDISAFLPAYLSATANPSNVCAGGSTSLEAHILEPQNYDYTYHWNAGSFSATGEAVDATPTANTTYTLTTSDKCYEYSATVDVAYIAFTSPTATVTASTNQVCPGNYVNYTCTTQNAGANPSYQWKKNGTNINGAIYSTYSVQPTNTDNISCTIKVNNPPNSCISVGSTYTSNAVNVSVDPSFVPTITIAGPPSVCQNSYGTFTATVSSNIPSSPYYAWYDNNTVLAQGYGATNVTLPGSFIQPSSNIKCVLTNTGCNASTITSNLLPVTKGQTPSMGIGISAAPGTYCSTPTIPSWQTPVNCSVNATTGTITKTANTYLWDTRVLSSNVIGNGNYVELSVASSAPTLLGLVYQSTPIGFYNVNYALYLNGNNVFALENGAGVTGSFTVNVGDKLRIGMFNNTVKYYLNNKLLYTSTQAVTGPLLMSVMLYQPNETAFNAAIQTAPLVNYTANVTGAGSNPTINWYLNNTLVLNNSSSYSNYIMPSDAVKYYVTSNFPDCNASAFSVPVVVNNTNTIPYQGVDETVMQSNPAYSLTGYAPTGGTWSGAGVSSSGTFNPAAAGSGTALLTYSYTNNSTCPATSSKKQIVVQGVGSSMGYPISIGSLQSQSTYSNCLYSDYRSNSTFASNGYKVYYSFTTNGNDPVVISTCGSTLDTYLSLLYSNGNVYASTSNSSGMYACGNTSQAVIATSTLPAGTYYIVVGGDGGTVGNYELDVWGVNYLNANCGGSNRLSSDASDLSHAVPSVFPNPTANQFTVAVGNTEDEYEIQLFDLNGILVKQLQSSQSSYNVSTDNLPNGMYWLVVKNNNGIILRERIQVMK